jgi:predicted aminopeptidase
MQFRYTRIFFSDFILLPAFLFCLFNADLVTYGLRMGKGQLSIVWGAHDFEEVFADPEVSDSVKEKLHLIDEIKQFAYDSIGLKPSDNYTTFFDQKDQRLMYVVTAAEKFQLKPYMWNFPVVGEVPYKGFFDAEKAKEEYFRLKMLGYDADIGGASGWSTLGWFQDPVLSSMLNRSEADLAELIIHELTHGTLFVKDSVEYNENLAQFVGVEGAKWFLRSKYGEASGELQSYLTSMEEDEQKTTFMLGQAKFLDTVYKSIEPTLSENEKQAIKQKTFLLIWDRARVLNLDGDSKFQYSLLRKMAKSGNTMFLQYTRYEAKRDDFSAEFSRSGNDLKLFVQNMVAKYGT